MTLNGRTITAAAMVLALASQAARAAEPGVVTASGAATGSYRPDVLRVKVLLSADGKDAAAAVAALKEKRDAFSMVFNQQGVMDPIVSSSITFSAATSGGPSMTPQQRQMAAIMSMQRGGNRRAPATQPSGVTVTATATADCPLPAADSDDAALVSATAMQDKIRGALAGAAPKKAMSPEEQEAAEEAAAQQQQNEVPGQPAAKPGEPTFTFVHKLTDAERAKLMSDAVAEARADAERMAKAAGGALGPVREVSSRSMGASDPDNPVAAVIQAEMGGAAAATHNAGEASDPQPGPLSYALQVTVKYGLGG